MQSLYACLWIPDFAVAALLRGEWNRRVPPVAVFTGTPPNCFVYAANEPARAGGVREAMPLAEAIARYGMARNAQRGPAKNPAKDKGRRPLRDEVKGKGIKPYRLRPTAPPVATGAPACPLTQSNEASSGQAKGLSDTEPSPSTKKPDEPTADIQTRERSTEAEQLTQQELIAMALTVSPRVEDVAPGLLIVDLAGLPDPHGSSNLLSHGAEKLGLCANVGVSANRFVAMAAARTQTGVTHIFPGQEEGFLSVLPVDTLPLDPREQDVFARWGIHTVGDLARLPEDSLVARFGTRGGQLSRLARGRQDAVMRPYEPPQALEEKSIDLDWQIIELEPLAFLLSGLLEKLCVKLQGHNLAAAEIRVALKLTDGSRYERAVAMSHPLADPRTLLTLVRIDLAAHPPGDAIEGVMVAAQPVPRRQTQFSLFDPALPSPEKLAVTLARLTQLVGAGRVGSPLLPDVHRPGAFEVEAFVAASVAGYLPVNGEQLLPGPAAREIRSEASAKRSSRAPVVIFPESQGRLLLEAVGETDSPSAAQSKVVVFASHVHDEAAVPLCGPANKKGFEIASTEAVDRAASVSRRAHAFRCLRPSSEAEVLMRDQLPIYVDSVEVQGPIRTRCGPWNVCGEWWADGWQFQEWDVEVRGRLYRICCELPVRKWYVTGIYD